MGNEHCSCKVCREGAGPVLHTAPHRQPLAVLTYRRGRDEALREIEADIDNLVTLHVNDSPPIGSYRQGLEAVRLAVQKRREHEERS